ncbi:MAG: AMP-binding protein [Sphingopyxis sp.]|nr:AMP-binding protein [Sphingopyxis sp.]
MIVAGKRRQTADQILANSEAAVRGFAERGVVEGDAVALLLRNDFAFFEASLAAQHLGAYAVPINWHGTPDEVAYVLIDCGARLLVAHADLYRRIAGIIPDGMVVLVVPVADDIGDAYGTNAEARSVPSGAENWTDFLARHDHGAVPRKCAETSAMIYTSGTTGKPKGVRHRPDRPDFVEIRAAIVAKGYGLIPGFAKVVLMNGPMYHTAPNRYGMFAAAVGADIVLQARFDAEEMLQLIERFRVTHMHIVPTMFVRLLRLPDAVRARYDLSSLKFVVHGAAPCPPDVKRQMIDWWGPVIHEYYGSTETGLITTIDSVEAIERPGSVGRAAPGVEIMILHPDGRAASVGEQGDIFVRSGAMGGFTYHGRGDEHDDMGRAGMVTVGDVGFLDADGYLFLCDRRRDMIISGGVNIYPAEIEASLLAFPGVRDCAVFGVPDAEFGEAICAWIETADGADLDRDALRRHVGQQLARFKIPATIEFTRALPREDSGKIFKRRLRDPYWKDQRTAIGA